MEVSSVELSKLVHYNRNNKKHSPEQVRKIADSIREFGFRNPVLVDKNFVIIAGHGRALGAELLGLKEIPCIKADDLTPEQCRAYRLADNRLADLAEYDYGNVKFELDDLKNLNFDINLTGFDLDMPELNSELDNPIVEDDFTPPVKAKYKVEHGDVFTLGRHRIMCGDSTKKEDVEKLMDGKKADMGFNDPPYGMKKENEGVVNDNLNYADLLEFNKKWIALQIQHIKDNGSFYCWGTDEPLMDIYSNILKPLIKTQKVTFRNLITWDKGNAQGQLSENTRSYAIADEKCLFVMCGVQGFNNNADNYFEGWEPVRDYLLKSRLEMGWDIPTMKKIVGHSDLSRDHWTCKSQFNFPTREVYNKMKAEADKLRNQTKNDAFKKEYDELKKEYYNTRAYFNNIHDNFNNVWHFNRAIDNKEHATPKPVELCNRAILSSCAEGGIVNDLFLGSGSTLIACEQTGRVCYGSEISPDYVSVILERYVKFKGGDADVFRLNADGSKTQVSGLIN